MIHLKKRTTNETAEENHFQVIVMVCKITFIDMLGMFWQKEKQTNKQRKTKQNKLKQKQNKNSNILISGGA